VVSRPDTCTNGTLTVYYTTGGAATNNVNYTASPASGSLVLTAGQTSATIVITPKAPYNLGAPKDFTVSLTNGPYVIGTPGSATCTLRTIFGDWAKKAQIQFSGYNRTETLTNFPALVLLGTNVSGFSYSALASPANGGDLRFSSATGDELNYEVDSWNTNGTSYVWVQVPALGSSNDTILAYWGNPAQTIPPACTTNGATWDTLYDGVWHMKQTNVVDSTTNHYNGTATANVSATNGPIGGADYFVGGGGATTFYVDVSPLPERTSFTYSGYLCPLAVNNNIFEQRNPDRDLYMNNGQLTLGWYNGGVITASGGSMASGSWYHVAGTWDGTSQRVFVNGVQVGSATPVAQTAGTPIWSRIGVADDGGGWTNNSTLAILRADRASIPFF